MLTIRSCLCAMAPSSEQRVNYFISCYKVYDKSYTKVMCNTISCYSFKLYSLIFLYRVHGRGYKLYKLGDSDLMSHLQGLATNREVIPQYYECDFELSFCESDDEEEEAMKLVG